MIKPSPAKPRHPASPDGSAPSTLSRVAVVIVTYNRSFFLRELLQSASALHDQPYRIVVVDNASNDDTQQVISQATDLFAPGMLINHRLDSNTGGSGGFYAGTKAALENGADWVWLMDDDVEILPDAFEKFTPWMERFDVIHGRRYDFDGSEFYWQARFNNLLGVPLPYTLKAFNRRGYAVTNSGTFEGMLINASVVRKIGLPDPRFFITWDDAAYAWVAAQHTTVVYVDEFVLKRKREQKQVNLGIRHLNDGSALFRFHVMRNRAYVGKYFNEYGKLNRVGFGLGTALTFAKEVVRLIAVHRSLKGLSDLVAGVKAGRELWRDDSWRPMDPSEVPPPPPPPAP